MFSKAKDRTIKAYAFIIMLTFLNQHFQCAILFKKGNRIKLIDSYADYDIDGDISTGSGLMGDLFVGSINNGSILFPFIPNSDTAHISSLSCLLIPCFITLLRIYS